MSIRFAFNLLSVYKQAKVAPAKGVRDAADPRYPFSTIPTPVVAPGLGSSSLIQFECLILVAGCFD